ncbi:MAG TPA: L,D-transpeptidase family protein [Rhizomicrobium sp.]|jgi:lipoprotein-anchoring transpeptidase ErfK/SrfK
MVLLRQLSVLTLMACTGFSMAVIVSQHPTLSHATKVTWNFTTTETGAAAVGLNNHVIQPAWAWTKDEASDAGHRLAQAFSGPPATPQQKPVRLAKQDAPKPVVKHVAKAQKPKPETKLASAPPPPALRPQIVEQPKPQIAVQPQIVAPPKSQDLASVTPPPPRASIVPQSQPPATAMLQSVPSPGISAPPPSPAELVRVTQRLKDSLTTEMLQHFEMFLYVSKAEHGPWAQRMYVFRKESGGDLTLLYNWPVSTGRELVEFAPNGSREPSNTPAGYYQLDPERMFTHYTSGQWHQPMPYAMFFNWENHGYQTGLAIHAASGDDIALLGKRSSAGCVRLAPENARVLFGLIRASYKGLVPKFAYDKRTATMANDGMLLKDTKGNLQYADGYKVLVFIEDYGGESVVAALF